MKATPQSDLLAGTHPLFEDEDARPFTRLPNDVSDDAKEMLAKLQKEGFVIRREQSDPIIVVTDGDDVWRIHSNAQVASFYRQHLASSSQRLQAPPPPVPNPGSSAFKGAIVGVLAVFAILIAIGYYQYEQSRRWWNIGIPSVSQTNDFLRKNLPTSWTTPPTERRSVTTSAPHPAELPANLPRKTISLLDGRTFIVADFIESGLAKADEINPGLFYFVGGDPYYDIYYAEVDQSFNISLLQEPLGLHRTHAEQQLTEALHLPKETMCFLRYSVLTPHWVSEQHSGKNLGFSFCPGATRL